MIDREAVLKRGEVPVDWYQPRGRRRLTFISLQDLMEGPTAGFVEVRSGCWWSTHPVRGVVIAGTVPQCNPNEAIARSLTAKLYPGARTLFVARGFVPVNPRDWA